VHVRRHLLLVTILWLALTALGELAVVLWDPFPEAAAREAEVVDEAFLLLVYLGMPVVAFVLAALLYSVFRFRSRGQPLEDGVPFQTHTPLILTWLGVTAALTVTVIVFPGWTGLAEMREHHDHEADVVVQVEGRQWFWRMTYPQHNIMAFGELVLPVDQVVRFEVTSGDVLHSFWIPAFRIKIDAVPGKVTFTTTVPKKTGTFTEDSGYRLQCAELCGLGHFVMGVPVRVVEQQEFQAWVAQQVPVQ
jgi:cytochrome c oxidase subunit 2